MTLQTECAVADIVGDQYSGAGCEPGVLCLYRELLVSFRTMDVRYCYWKSSRRAAAALAGGSDLDLLVGKESLHAAQRALLDCGFKLFPSIAPRDHPSIQSFLGYDDDSGAVIHVHLHARLVLGGALLKSYRIPWEDALLDRATAPYDLPLRVLDPASEAVLLVVRACLELRRTDPVVLRNWAAMTRKFALDRADLAARVERDAVRQRASELLGEGLADGVTGALYDERPLEQQRALRRAVRRALARFRTYGAVERVAREAWRTAHWMFGALNKRVLLWPRPWSRFAPGGGIVVALLGVDGSGKTTLIRGLREWLGAEVDVLPLYLGTGGGRPSLLLLPLKLLVPLGSVLFRSKPKGASHGTVTDAPPGAAYSALLTVWATVLAVEKRMKLIAGRRAASRGMVVITDRYPQDQIAGFNDGPLLTRLGRVPRWLRRFEASAYALARALPPDLVIKLVASPELIASREPTMDPTTASRRTAELQLLSFPGSLTVDIAASQPAADVLRLAKRQIWQLL
jgi:hypothetical protein